MTERSSRVKGKKSVWTNYRLVRTVHVYSSMLMLLIMLFFTLTGFTLNHRDWFSGRGQASEQQLTLPAELTRHPAWQSDPLVVAAALRQWLSAEHGVRAAYVSYDWDADDQLLQIDFKRPGGRSSVEVSPSQAQLLLIEQPKGNVAWLNDLHMGRYSSSWWRGFIDLSALVMLLFTLTGVWLVIPQHKRRLRLLAVSGLGLAVTLLFSVLATVSF